jgi:dihydrolipoamide dehydrogenase
MADSFTVKVPDIGNFDSVEVIDIHIKIGDEIIKEDALITVESDKASMDIPSPTNGIVKKILVQIGDKVKKGSVVLETKSVDHPQKNLSDTSKKG